MSKAKVSVVSTFPPGFFLENITATADNGLLVSVATRKEIYHIRLTENGEAAPFLLEALAPDQFPMGIIRSPQDGNVFYNVSTDFLGLGSKRSHLNVIDFSNPATGGKSQSIMTFPPETTGLNGFCALSDSVLLAADSFGESIWRIDLDLSSFPPKAATAKKWLSDPATMKAALVLPDFQPGANGLKYSAKTGYVYYSSTQQRLFCRVRVDAATLAPAGSVEIITRGMQGDDLILDDQHKNGPIAYLTTHRDNTILKVPLDQTHEINIADLEVVAEGTIENEAVLGPTAGTWAVGQEGRVAYFTTDGGLKHPLEDGIVRCAKVVKVEF